MRVFLWDRGTEAFEFRFSITNEEEYLAYLKAVFAIEDIESDDDPLYEQLWDEGGLRVPGCYRTKPVDVE